MKFNELIKNENILKAIKDLEFENPTEIQVKAIPIIEEGYDLIAQSQTGTGKTLAFAAPTIEKIDKDTQGVQILIICPTRELSIQVAREYKKLIKYDRDILISAVFGGEQISKQIYKLKRRPQIIVGTPGRLMDHMRRRTIRLDNVNTVILDEADEMLKMGFKEDIEFIFSKIEEKTQNLLFSATIPKTIEKLANDYLKDYKKIVIEAKNVATETVEQSYVPIIKKHKKSALIRILDAKIPDRCLIFCNTKKMVDELIIELQDYGYSAERIHGDLKQEHRMSVINQFNKGGINILVATDVAGRGLDIKDLDLVINYDIPEKEDSYVHRIGRSGRAGKEGEAITLVSKNDKSKLKSIEGFMKKTIDYKKVPSLKKVNEAKVNNLINNVLNNYDKEENKKYEEIIDKVQKEGYNLKELCIALLKTNLSLHDTLNEQDYNDHLFNKRRKEIGNKKSSNNKGRNRNRNRSRRRRRNK